jgi:hypothetical protein
MWRVSTKHLDGPLTLAGRFPLSGRWPVLRVADERVSVNFLEPPRAASEVAVRDYGLHEGVLAEMVGLGAVLPPHRYIESGYVRIPVCHLTTAFAGLAGARRVPPPVPLPRG